MTAFLLTLPALAAIAGCVLGVRGAKASHQIDALLAACHRDVDVNDAADMSIESAL